MGTKGKQPEQRTRKESIVDESIRGHFPVARPVVPSSTCFSLPGQTRQRHRRICGRDHRAGGRYRRRRGDPHVLDGGAAPGLHESGRRLAASHGDFGWCAATQKIHTHIHTRAHKRACTHIHELVVE